MGPEPSSTVSTFSQEAKAPMLAMANIVIRILLNFFILFDF
jgi:hypothetical protein